MFKDFITTVEVEFTCNSPEHARERVEHLPFGDFDCGFRILGTREGKIPEGEDEAIRGPERERLWITRFAAELGLDYDTVLSAMARMHPVRII